MKILAIETSTDMCSAALLLDNTLFERYQLASREHAQLILPMINALLTDAGISLRDLSAVAFGAGPGGFTGLRIAAGVVQGLSFAADLPVVGVSTLQALAQGAYLELGATRVLAGLDARMGEIYYGAYQYNTDNTRMQAIVQDMLLTPSPFTPPEGTDWLAVGSAWQNHASLLQSTLKRYPMARDIARLAVFACVEGKTVSAENALPIYLRDDVVNKGG